MTFLLYILLELFVIIRGNDFNNRGAPSLFYNSSVVTQLHSDQSEMVSSKSLRQAQNNRTQDGYSSLWKKLPDDCGKRHAKKSSRRVVGTPRIVNGETAEIGQFPWMARLGGYDPSNDQPVFICGGSLINKYYVISAAHCSEDIFLVRLGEHFEDSETDCDDSGYCALPHQDIDVKRSVVDNFCVDSARNDMMVVELKTAAEFNDFVQPICLPRDPVVYEDLIGKPLTVAGWGLNQSEPEHQSPGVLMYTAKPVAARDICSERYNDKLNDLQLCLADDKVNNGCMGDSGGPAIMYVKTDGVSRGVLMGVVSFGPPKCESVHSVYSYVPNFLRFIEKTIEKR